MQKKYKIDTTISINYELVNGDIIDLDVPIYGNIYTDSGDRLNPPDIEIEVSYFGTIEDLNDQISSEIDNVGQEVSLDKINQIIEDRVSENWEELVE